MSNLFTAIHMTDIWTSTSEVFLSISPFLIGILGLLIAFFVVETIVDLIKIGRIEKHLKEVPTVRDNLEI